jgi:TolB-like protein/Tfp pilus assembly protein PilF
LTDTPTERAAESAWTRLRRRKVVQWTVAYAAGAWATLEVLGFAADTYGWPAIVAQLAMLGLALGLPVVVTLAWFHGERSEQRVTGRELAILTALLMVGGGLLWWYADRRPTTPAATAADRAAPAANADARPSIAVLPFDNRSRLEDDAYFVDGIHDDILTQLSKVSALRVISRTSVERFRQSELSVQEIAQRLGVKSILEGAVQRAGDRVRINVQLIDAATDAHVWAESYDRELTAAEVFAIQSEVASAIAGALKTALTPAEQARAQIVPTKNLPAWEAYQLGKQRMANRTSAGLTEAERHFQKAVALDPHFALAWVGLADTLVLQTYYGGRPLDSGLDAAEQAVGRALALDPSLGEAWASAGLVAQNRLQFARSEEQLRRAISLNPNYAAARHWLSELLMALGRQNEALAMIESAAVLDPWSAVIVANLGAVRRSVGRFDEALIAFNRAIEIDPTLPNGYAETGITYAHGFGRFDTALPWYEKAASLDPGSPGLLVNVAYGYWHLGDDAEAGRWLTRALALGEGTAITNAVAAVLNLSREDVEAARRYAQLAAEMDSWGLAILMSFDLREGDYTTARARYAEAFPKLFARNLATPNNDRDACAAVELAVVLQKTGEEERARALLDRSEAYFRTILLAAYFRWYPIAIHALRGDSEVALAMLREAAQTGLRSDWRYYRDFAPEFASIRNEPKFKAIFADIERDMARQRAALAARPKGALLDLAATDT